MPKFGPISRRDLIRYLQQLGFEGPYPGAIIIDMVRETTRLVLPNPHRSDIGRGLLNKILQQVVVLQEPFCGWIVGERLRGKEGPADGRGDLGPAFLWIVLHRVLVCACKALQPIATPSRSLQIVHLHRFPRYNRPLLFSFAYSSCSVTIAGRYLYYQYTLIFAPNCEGRHECYL